jgi:uncharacterized protein YbjT (DUF2867 family)
MQPMQHKILVTGATGTVGSQLVNQLYRAGHQVRALTRNPNKATFPAGVEVFKGDLTAPQTLIPALEGVSALHLITFDRGSGGFQPLRSGGEIVELAKKAGVQRVTVLQGVGDRSVEKALEESDLCWTFIQPVEFMSNTLKWTKPIRAKGEVSEPFANRLTAIVHEADIAAVAAAALVEEGHGGKTYTVTGPQVLTQPEMVQMIGEATGRKLTFVELSIDQAREEWKGMGLPDEVIGFLMMAYGDTPPAGYTVLPTVEQVTGQQARTFAQWAREHAKAFAA